jgi:hypothetical protein
VPSAKDEALGTSNGRCHCGDTATPPTAVVRLCKPRLAVVGLLAASGSKAAEAVATSPLLKWVVSTKTSQSGSFLKAVKLSFLA